MAKFPIIGPENLDEDQQALWDTITKGPRNVAMGGPDMKELLGPYNAWLLFPKFGLLMTKVGDEMRWRTSLPGKLRELATVTTAIFWKARMEFDGHSHFARREGISDDVINAIGAGTPPPYADESERIVHQATNQLLGTGTLDGEMRSALEGILGLKGVVEFVALVGLYTIVCFTANVADAENPKGFTIDPEALGKFLRQGSAVPAPAQ